MIAVQSALIIIMNILVLVLISWKLTLITVGSILPVVLIWQINGRFQRWIQNEIQSEKAVMGSVSEEAISCIRTVKAFATEKYESERYKISNNNTYNLGVKQAMWNGSLYAIWNLILNSAMAAIIYFGAVMALDGEITVGALSSFLLYMIFLIFQFLMIGYAVGSIFRLYGAVEKVIQMTKIAVNAGDSEGTKPNQDEIEGTIELQNVSFSYPSKPDVQVTKDVSI